MAKTALPSQYLLIFLFSLTNTEQRIKGISKFITSRLVYFSASRCSYLYFALFGDQLYFSWLPMIFPKRERRPPHEKNKAGLFAPVA